MLLDMTIQFIHQHYKKTLGLFMGSLVGLTVDLVVFQWAIYSGLDPCRANMCSAMLAIITTYLFLTNSLFSHRANLKTFVFFFSYSMLSIVCCSLGILYLTQLTSWPPLVSKLMILPFSFMVNASFSHLILRKK